MKIDSTNLRTLQNIIEQEIAQYTLYLQLLGQEYAAVTTLQSEVVTQLSEKRAAVMEQVSRLKNQRIEIVSRCSDGEVIRLTELADRIAAPSDKKRLATLVKKLKDVVSMVEVKNKEFNLLLNFSLGLVNGEISLLWSASQTVSRVYNSFGSMTEGAQPAPPRSGSLLGQA